MKRKSNITRDAAISLLLLKDPTLERRVLKVVQMVESGGTFAIRELAAEFRLSPSYLQRLFKHETGIRMGEWLSEQRLQRAAYLLSNSYLSVKEITHAVGYEHTSSFIRASSGDFFRRPRAIESRTTARANAIRNTQNESRQRDDLRPQMELVIHSAAVRSDV